MVLVCGSCLVEKSNFYSHSILPPSELFQVFPNGLF